MKPLGDKSSLTGDGLDMISTHTYKGDSMKTDLERARLNIEKACAELRKANNRLITCTIASEKVMQAMDTIQEAFNAIGDQIEKQGLA